MDMVQVLGVGVVGTLLAVTLSRINGTHGLLVGLATGCLLLVMLLGQTEELGSFFRELAGEGILSAAYTGDPGAGARLPDGSGEPHLPGRRPGKHRAQGGAVRPGPDAVRHAARSARAA